MKETTLTKRLRIAASATGAGACIVLTMILALSVFAAFAGEKEGGKFVTLYNGKDLSGWKTEGNWVPEADGVLAIKPRPGEEGWKRYGSYLWAEKQYSDFVFDFEFKHPPGGNSGFFFRCGDLADPVKTGLEVQILDCYGKEGELGHHDLGGVIRTIGPTKNMSKAPGEWNRMVVTCKGTNLKVKLNGEQIVDVDLKNTDSKDKPLKGYLGLQDHGQVMWFRNIRIKEL